MENAISLLVLFIPAIFLAWSLFPACWLNQRPAITGRIAEWMAWLGLGITLAVGGFFFATGSTRLSSNILHTDVLGARMDALSIPMLSLVAFLGAIILRFSRNYLAGDSQQGYFFKWMVFTLGTVMLLVVSPGLMQFFLAWVLSSLGLHKLLVYFPERLGTLLSARKKFIVSRIGDLCLLLGFAGIFNIFGSQDFTTIFALLESPSMQTKFANASWISWLIIVGAILKSAQFPFHTWLPDTMGAPTPVSALMHAGIINAGGFLVIRLSPLLVAAPNALHCLAITGIVTALFASMVMLTQTSVKRSLAYSTIAQMGFMFLQCGLGAFYLAFLHIIAHSLYKGHAFLSSGSAVDSIKRIHSSQNKDATLSLPLLATIVAGACAIIVGLNMAFGIQPSNKPGMIVFSVILAMAVAHLIIKRIQTVKSAYMLSIAFAWGSAFACLYFGLALGTQALLMSELPQLIQTSWMLESVLAIVLFALLATSIIIQYSQINPISQKLRETLYVHALNGFYFNTLANRVARTLGMVPAKR